jgi:hypothetical protein
MPPIRPKGVIHIGIDPGKTGGLTAIFPGGPLVAEMPTTERDLWDWISGFGKLDATVSATVEWINPAIQAIGKSHMSKLYGNYAAIRMALIGCKIPFEAVQPQKWQPALGIPKRSPSETVTRWKDRLRGLAQQLYPDLPCWEWKLENQRNVSDSILIAHYGKSRREGG